MWGILRVMHGSGSGRAQRFLTMRQAPALSLLEDTVGGRLSLIEGFDSILHEGGSVPCIAFQSMKSVSRRPNALANMFWLQSLLRRKGFAGVSPLAEGSLIGTVIVLYGDDTFLKEIIHTVLELPG